ncbi:hypothetical protein GCM10020229_18260 [Kitasatospora albolonga]
MFEDRVNGTLVSERFAASTPWAIASVIAATAAVAGTAISADLRQRVTPLDSSCMGSPSVVPRR